MIQTLLTGLFALSGVTLGVLLDPLKASFAWRSQTRLERANRCSKLIEAATAVRSLSLEINFILRQDPAPSAPHDEHGTVFSQYRASRREMKAQIALLQLSGPDALAEAALAIRRADQRLRSVRTIRVPEDDLADRDKFPEEIVQAANALEAEIIRFAQSARKST